MSISHESIYYYVYEKAEKYKQLYKHLRTNRPKRNQRGKRKRQGIIIKNRVSIHDRAEIINRRKRLGDWESDTVEFKRNLGSRCLSVQYERKSQLARISKVKDKSAEETLKALIKVGNSVGTELFKSVTFDNGSEGSRHH